MADAKIPVFFIEGRDEYGRTSIYGLFSDKDLAIEYGREKLAFLRSWTVSEWTLDLFVNWPKATDKDRPKVVHTKP